MDRRITSILNKEINRQTDTIELIASENFASKSVMSLAGSEFTNKYAEGYPGKRYYNGCEHMDEIETLAIETLKGVSSSVLLVSATATGASFTEVTDRSNVAFAVLLPSLTV